MTHNPQPPLTPDRGGLHGEIPDTPEMRAWFEDLGERVQALTHDPLCPYRPVKWHGWMQYDKEIPCQCHFIRTIRGDERMSCIEDVEGAYIVGADGKILNTSHPEYSHDGTDNWNAAISVAVSYLKGLD